MAVQDNCLKFDMTKFDVGEGTKTERTSAKLKVLLKGSVLRAGRRYYAVLSIRVVVVNTWHYNEWHIDKETCQN